MTNISPSFVSCSISGVQILSGKLFENVKVDESTWSVEDQKLVRILLAKALQKQGKVIIRSIFLSKMITYDIYM